MTAKTNGETMTAKPHPITLDQLARLFDAANRANSELAAAHRMRPRDRDAIERARQRSSALNSAYDAAKRQHKRQKKAAQKSAMLTSFYLDYKEANQL